MAIIRKIINWIKNFFRKLFGKNNKNKKVQRKKVIVEKRNVKKQASIDSLFDEEMPSYMIISNIDKEKLVYSIALMKNVLIENNTKIREKEEKELINIIKNNPNINKDLLNEILPIGTEKIDRKNLEILVKNFSVEDKKRVIDKYQEINKREEVFNNHLEKIDKAVELIENTEISIITKDEIEKEVNEIINDKKLDDVDNKVDKFDKNVTSIIENVDKVFLSEVIKEYNKVNYVTVSTKLIDKNYERFKKLEDDFKNHRYNKFYYEREISRIKQELNQIKNLKNRKDVSNHIELLRKELYTKSKDKYDILYNNEIFMSFEKECDVLLDKINVKVIDIKKEEVKEEKEKKDKDKYLENILLRFQDIELARKLIVLDLDEEVKLNTKNDVIDYVNNMYSKFNEGIFDNFNFERNKSKTELVILYNRINRINSVIKKEPYLSIDHINFKMSDLVEASKVKKEELSGLLSINNINEYDESLVDEKLNILSPTKKHVLKKSTNEGKKDNKE